MSETVDANVLVYADNVAAPEHEACVALLNRLGAGSGLVYFFWPALLGYVRIVTHPSILPSPLSPSEALANVESLVAPPHVRTPGEADGFLATFRDVTDGRASGNQVPDAHLVALMHQHGVSTIHTRDRAFRQYDRIRAVDPLRPG